MPKQVSRIHHTTSIRIFRRNVTLITVDLLNTPLNFDSDARLGVTADGVVLVDLGYATDWRKFIKLDRLDRPGITEVEFFGLFAKCEVCALVMTRQVFPAHYCRRLGEDGLELTDQE
jgi:hypothetical protein